MDPAIAKDLELRLIGDDAYRLRVMGIKVDTTAPMTPEDIVWGRFARQIRVGPWDRIVARRAEALRQRIFHLETMAWMFGTGDSHYLAEARRAWTGWS